MAEKRPRAARTWIQFEAKSKFYDYVSTPKYWFYQSDPGVKHDNKQCRTAYSAATTTIRTQIESIATISA